MISHTQMVQSQPPAKRNDASRATEDRPRQGNGRRPRYDRCPKVFLSAVALAAAVIFWL